MEVVLGGLTWLVPLVAGALAWIFWREWLLSDRFWIAVVAVVIAGAIWQHGERPLAVAVAAIGIGIWLWLERSSNDQS